MAREAFAPARMAGLYGGVGVELFEKGLERGGVGGFYEVVIEAGFLDAAAVVVLAPARERHQHHFFAPRLLADLPGGVIPVEYRHTEIQQDELRPKALRLFDSGEAVVGDPCFVAHNSKHLRERYRGVLVVVDDQNAMPQERRRLRPDYGFSARGRGHVAADV